MTATPIPRTLAMAAYADLDTSVIDELPPGREPVGTIAVPESRRDEVVERVRRACADGQQAYWVCPLIEESETLDHEAAEARYERLTEALPEVRVGLVHGRMFFAAFFGALFYARNLAVPWLGGDSNNFFTNFVLWSGYESTWPTNGPGDVGGDFTVMRQELVFIGQGLDQDQITRALDDCLLSEDEVLRGKAYWKTLEDPFPAWEPVQ